MNNSAFSSALAGILFGFSALIMILNKGEYLSGGMLAAAGFLMVIHAILVRKKKTTCKLKS